MGQNKIYASLRRKRFLRKTSVVVMDGEMLTQTVVFPYGGYLTGAECYGGTPSTNIFLPEGLRKPLCYILCTHTEAHTHSHTHSHTLTHSHPHTHIKHIYNYLIPTPKMETYSAIIIQRV